MFKWFSLACYPKYANVSQKCRKKSFYKHGQWRKLKLWFVLKALITIVLYNLKGQKVEEHYIIIEDRQVTIFYNCCSVAILYFYTPKLVQPIIAK